MNIYVIRHGQTDANLRHELQGRRDIPLNEQGRRQAEMVRAFFEERGVLFDRVYSSPLGRAIETARIVSGRGVPVETDDRLLEMDYGPYEGMDLRMPALEVVTFFSDFARNPAPAGMEQLSSVTARAGRFIEDVARGSGESVLVSTHAILMKGILDGRSSLGTVPSTSAFVETGRLACRWRSRTRNVVGSCSPTRLHQNRPARWSSQLGLSCHGYLASEYCRDEFCRL